ncbi:MAG: hypothetical protein HPY81_11010 [Firmicutes bacterium]|nr:hypothetical protein [Bacillota bacterium]
MNRKLYIGSIITIVALLVGLVGYNVAFAQSGEQAGIAKSNFYQAFVSKLAANLGMDQEKVAAALETTKQQCLDEAVKQGLLTQEQADKIAARKGIGFYGPGGRKDFQKPGFRGFPGEEITSVLGVTPEQLKADFKAGKTLAQIVSEHGLTMDQFKQKLLDYEKNKIAQKVADGKLTQEQADKMMQSLEKRVANLDKVGIKGQMGTRGKKQNN